MLSRWPKPFPRGLYRRHPPPNAETLMSQRPVRHAAIPAVAWQAYMVAEFCAVGAVRRIMPLRRGHADHSGWGSEQFEGGKWGE